MNRNKPPTQDDKARIVVDAIVIAHFVVGNLCIILGAFTNLFDSFAKNYKNNPGVDFLFHVMDFPVYFLLEKCLAFYYFILSLLQKSVTTLSAVQPGSFFYYLLAECVVMMGSAFYGVCAYLILKSVISVSDE